MSANDSIVGQNSKASKDDALTTPLSSASHATNDKTLFMSTTSLNEGPSQDTGTLSDDLTLPAHELFETTDSARPISGRLSQIRHVTPPPRDLNHSSPISQTSPQLLPANTPLMMADDYHPKSYSNSAQADPLRRTRASSQAVATEPISLSLDVIPKVNRVSRKRKASDASLGLSTVSPGTSLASSPAHNAGNHGSTGRRSSKRLKRDPTIREESEDYVSPSKMKGSRTRSRSQHVGSDTVSGVKALRSGSITSERNAPIKSRESSKSAHAVRNSVESATVGLDQVNTSLQETSNMEEDNMSQVSTDIDSVREGTQDHDCATAVSPAERPGEIMPSTTDTYHVPKVLVSVEAEETGGRDYTDISGTQTPDLRSRDSSPQVTAMPKRSRQLAKTKVLPAIVAEDAQSASVPKTDGGRPDLQGANAATLLHLKRLKGGPGKRKTSTNWKLDALYDRQAALKAQFKAVARLVQSSNEILATKAMQKVADDPSLYKLEPEYLAVTHELNTRHEKKQTEIKDHLAMKMEALEDWYARKREYQQRMFESTLVDVRDNAVHRVKAGLLDVLGGKSVNDFDDNSTVIDDSYCNIREFVQPKPGTVLSPKKLATPRVIAPVAKRGKAGRRGGRGQGRWPRQGPADAEPPSSQASLENASFYDAPIARKASMMSIPKILDIAVEDDETLQSEADDDLGKKSFPTKELLGSSLPSHLQDSDTARLVIGTSLRSATNTPASVFPANGVSLEHRDVDGNDMLPGDHEVVVPSRRRGRGGMPNNRLIVKPWYTFGEHEIGIRAMNYKDPSNQKEAGLLNPRKVHFDHTSANGDKLVNYTEEDFDQKLVRFYGVHPKYGLPLVGCKNRELSTISESKDDQVMWKQLVHTDFSKSLPPTKPKLRLFMAEDGTMSSESLSRSEPIMRITANFEKLGDRKELRRALWTAGHLDVSLKGIATYDGPARDKLDVDLVIGELVDAANILRTHPHAGDVMEHQMQLQLDAQHKQEKGITESEQEINLAAQVVPTAIQELRKDSVSHGLPTKDDLSPPKRKRGAAKSHTSPVRRSGRDRKPTTKLSEVNAAHPEPAHDRPAQGVSQSDGPPSDGGSLRLSFLADACDDLSRRDAHFRYHPAPVYPRHPHELGHQNNPNNNFIPYQIPPHLSQYPLHVHPSQQQQPHQHQYPHPHPGPRFGTFGPPSGIERIPYNSNVHPQSQGMPLQHMLQMPPPPPPTTQPQHNSPYTNLPPQHISPYPPTQHHPTHSHPEQIPPFYPFQHPPQPPQPMFPPPNQPPPPPPPQQQQQQQSRPQRNAPREIRPRTKSFSFVPDRAPMPIPMQQYMGIPPLQSYLPPPPPPPSGQGAHYPSPYPPIMAFPTQQGRGEQVQQQQQVPGQRQQQQQQQQQHVSNQSNITTNNQLEGQRLGQRLEPLNPTHAAILHAGVADGVGTGGAVGTGGSGGSSGYKNETTSKRKR